MSGLRVGGCAATEEEGRAGAVSQPARPPTDRAVRLIAIRHGRTAWNAQGRYQGHADPILDETGGAQAQATASALAPLGPVLLVVSDLRRAVATGAPLARAAGLVPVVDARLREVDLGAWEGLTRAEAAGRFPDEMAAWEAGADVARGGGESRAAAGRRASGAILEHVASLPSGSVAVVVSHGLVLRSAVRELGATGHVHLAGDPPHLDNGAWLDLTITP